MFVTFAIDPTFTDVVAKMLGVERALDAKRLPATWRVEPGVKVPTPVSPTGPKIPRMFEVPAFIETVAKTFGAERAFDAKRLPATCKVEPGVKVPTPVRPTGPKIPRMLEVAALSDVEAKTFGAERALDAKRLPATWRVEVGTLVPTPVSPTGPKIPRMLDTEALSDVDANTTGVTSAFDAKTLPWTWRFELGVAVPIPTKNAGP